MNLHRMLAKRAAEGAPLRVGLIGAGKFGSMYLAQAQHTPGIHLVGDRGPRRPRAHARRSRASAGHAERFAARSLADAAKRGTTSVTDDAARADRRAGRRHRDRRDGQSRRPASATRSRAARTASTS